MRLFAAVKDMIDRLAGVPTERKSRVGLSYEPATLSTNATVSSIQSALRAAEMGDTRQLFTLYRDMTVSGTHVQGELNKRKLAILSAPMSVLAADKNSPEDVKAAEAVTQAIGDCENWTDGITHLLDATLWPLATVEKIFRAVQPGERAAAAGLRYTLRRLEPVNPAVYCFRQPTGRIGSTGTVAAPLGAASPWEEDVRFYQTDEQGRILTTWETTYGADPARHIIHRGHLLIGVRDCWGGPLRAILFWWLLSTLARDWFGRGMERWGSPFPVGHTDARNPEALALLQEAFSLATKIGGLVVDNATQIELKEIAATGMADAYEKFLNVCNREVSKAIIGQTLSAEAQSTGLGSSVGKLHSDVREDIHQFDQLRTGETLRNQLFKQLLEINGLRGNPPKIVWGGLSDADAKLFAETLDIVGRAGLEPTDEALPTVSEKLGLQVRRKAGTSVPATGGFAAGASAPANRGFAAEEPQAPREEDEEDTEKLSISPRDARLRRLALLSGQARMADSLGVPAAWLNPMRDFLEEIQRKVADESLTDNDLLTFLDAAVQRVPELFGAMDVDGLAKVLEAGMGQAVIEEARKGIRKAKI